MAENSEYYLSLELGSKYTEVTYYNPTLWSETISNNSNPSEWFLGTSNCTGASSKIMIRNTGINDMNTYGVFFQFFYKWIDVSVSGLRQNGYDSSYLNENYPYYYNVWEYEYQRYYFSDQAHLYRDDDNFFIFRNPSNLSMIFKNYNNFSTTVNSDPTMQSLNISLPVVSGDDFLWHYLINELIIASPINSYLTDLIDSLECQNVTIYNNILLLERKGINSYIVQVEFNDHGLMDSLRIKNLEGDKLYELTSWYPKDVSITIFIFIGVGLILLIAWSLYLRRKKEKFYIEN